LHLIRLSSLATGSPDERSDAVPTTCCAAPATCRYVPVMSPASIEQCDAPIFIAHFLGADLLRRMLPKTAYRKKDGAKEPVTVRE